MSEMAAQEATVFAALGTNLGDRMQHLEMAITLLTERVGAVMATSRLYRTAPQYVEDQPAFFNLVVQIRTALTPVSLLEAFKAIERDIGRTQGGLRYGPRVIDVDVLLYDSQALVTETVDGPLIIPHERIAERDFVLVPLCDLVPEMEHPTLHKSMQTLLHDLTAKNESKSKSESENENDAPGSSFPGPVSLLPVVKRMPWVLGSKTYVMGILNVTPDSFSGDGVASDTSEEWIATAVTRALEMQAQGVDIIDIGGESTRPGAPAVTLQQELARVIPVVRAIREQCDIAISIDTSKAHVAQQAVQHGANMVNDVSAGERDEAMLTTVAALRVPFVMMHMRGTPSTMSTLKEYDDVVQDVATYLSERVAAATRAGIFRWNLVVDPGVGFAKHGPLNVSVLRRLRELRVSIPGTPPILVGASRKGFIGQICGRGSGPARDAGTHATTCAAIQQHADLVRVHDTAASVDVAKMADAIWR